MLYVLDCIATLSHKSSVSLDTIHMTKKGHLLKMYYSVLVQGLSDAIGGAVAGSLQRVVAARYEEVFKSVVIPGFEKGCQEMFRQIDEAFRRGTTECE